MPVVSVSAAIMDVSSCPGFVCKRAPRLRPRLGCRASVRIRVLPTAPLGQPWAESGRSDQGASRVNEWTCTYTCNRLRGTALPAWNASVMSRTPRARRFSCSSSMAYILIVLSMIDLGHPEGGQLGPAGLQRGPHRTHLVLQLELGVAGEKDVVAGERRVAGIAGRQEVPQPAGRGAFPVGAAGGLDLARPVRADR